LTLLPVAPDRNDRHDVDFAVFGDQGVVELGQEANVRTCAGEGGREVDHELEAGVAVDAFLDEQEAVPFWSGEPTADVVGLGEDVHAEHRAVLRRHLAGLLGRNYYSLVKMLFRCVRNFIMSDVDSAIVFA
jgi:hypothetical protein